MTEEVFSNSWHRVAQLKPRLRAHVAIHRHVYRGQVWYVLQDELTGSHYRFDPFAQFLIGLFDGRRTVHEAWEAACERLGDDAPTQDDTIHLLAKLHGADVLQSDITPDTLELFHRGQRHSRNKTLQRFSSPFSVRLPLIDPNRFLERWLSVVRPLFSRSGATVWLAIVATAAVLTAMHWVELTHDLAERTLVPANLILLAVAYPLVKGLHELGHAFASKVWGGAVHEMGVMFLVFMPVPYVDASASSAFPERHRRMIVGAAGIAVELLLASLALALWLAVEPGMVRDLAFNVMLIGGVSTALFNGNPLLRFDGYYVLSDAIDIPNLADRSRRYVAFLIQRHLFGLADATSPVSAEGERRWFLFYAVASFLYRLVILFGIALFVASEFPVVGMALAGWGIAMQVIWPILKALGFVLHSPRLARRRARAVGMTSMGLCAVAGVVFLQPANSWTLAEGVVWLPDQAYVRAETEGFVRRVLVDSGARVSVGDPILEAEDTNLESRAAILAAKLEELQLQLRSKRTIDIVAAQQAEDEIRAAESELHRVNERRGALQIAAKVAGTFVAHRPRDLPGRFLRQGDLVGYVIAGPSQTVRVVVPQSEVDLIKSRTRGVEVRLGYKGENVVAANLLRAVPAATDQLPAIALGTAGGGRLPVDPLDEQGLKTTENVFQFDVELPAGAPAYYLGQRAHVRFDHGHETLGAQWYRQLRQLFLARLEI